MDNDMLDLADRLCTVAGMLMEDATPLAIMTARLDVEAKTTRLAELQTTTEDMRVLIAAAQILVRLR